MVFNENKIFQNDLFHNHEEDHHYSIILLTNYRFYQNILKMDCDIKLNIITITIRDHFVMDLIYIFNAHSCNLGIFCFH
jgi:hypothetical protein